jgi:hypothetical protein
MYIKMCFTTILRGKIKKKVEDEKTRSTVPNLVPRTDAGGQRSLQELQDEIDHQ